MMNTAGRRQALRLPLIVLALSSYPVAAQAPPDGDRTLSAEELDQKWSTYRDRFALPTVVDEGDHLNTKLKALHEFAAELHELERLDAPEDQAGAKYGLGRLHLNLACESLSTETPAALSLKQQPIYRDMLTKAANVGVERALGYFNAAAKLNAGDASLKSRALVAGWASAPESVCEATRATWAAKRRPGPTKISKQECLERARAGRSTNVCVAVVAAACRAGTRDVCDTAAKHAYGHGDNAGAAELWRKACRGTATSNECGAADLVPNPTRATEDRTECVKGDTLACVRAARGAPRPNAVCTAASVLPDDTAGAPLRCTQGDAAACWALAAEQLGGARLGPPYAGFPFSPDPVPILSDTRASDKEACEDGRAGSCERYASMLRGANRLPWLERACAMGSGCGKLGQALSDSGRDIPRALDLMTRSCVDDDDTESCTAAAKLLHSGEHVPRSRTCAAFIGLQTCTPTSLDRCADINWIFHPAAP